MELRVAGLLAGAQCRVALHDVDLAALHILGAAVHEFLHAVGDVDLLGELFLLIDAGFLRRFTAALVNEHLRRDLLGVFAVLNEVDLHTGAQKLRHGFLHELVGDRLLGLILVAGLGGEVVGHQHEAFLHVGIGDLALALLVLVILTEVLVDGTHQRQTGGLLGAAAVLQEAGVVVVLHHLHAVGEAQSHIQLHLILGLVLAVAATALGIPAHGSGKSILPHQLGDIVGDARLIEELLRLELPCAHFPLEAEGNACVDNRLPLHDVAVIFHRDVNVGKDLQIRQPADGRAGALFVGGQLLHLKAADVLALFKVEGIFLPLAEHRHIHVA